ncbi:hypothetical protein GA0061080_100725 [Gilliamella intestini]|uniref:Uncharacterized protein n=1 Tax=Gilliamella intestini TaxID=1798183 RepID=A0A1C3ZXJ1_9GAMM|nr:hypothetical protein GA0061080_100725 [Gilliamella intestini]
MLALVIGWKRYVSTIRDKTATLYQAVVCKNLYNQFPDILVNKISVRDMVAFFEKQEQINLKRARTILVQARSAINWCISRQVIDSCELMCRNFSRCLQ